MKKFIVLIPLYNDWKSLAKLLSQIDSEINDWHTEVSVLIVNDASTEKCFGLEFSFKNIKSIKILNMKENRSHGRCIATGLKYIYKNEDFDRVIIMDADGEDRPEELNDFFKKSQENPNITVTGNRFKRSEGFLFKFLYEMHKLLTLIFTGRLIKFGNFTCLPKEHVHQLIQKPYLWNSFSGSITRAIDDRTFIHSRRGVRYFLPSKMSFFLLILHSFCIISVFRRAVIIRSIVFFLVYLFLIFDNISILTLFPIIFLLIFVSIILKLSRRTNLEGLGKALNNIASIDILNKLNTR